MVNVLYLPVRGTGQSVRVRGVARPRMQLAAKLAMGSNGGRGTHVYGEAQTTFEAIPAIVAQTRQWGKGASAANGAGQAAPAKAMLPRPWLQVGCRQQCSGMIVAEMGVPVK